MSGIVCAIRGGAASQPTIKRAIGLALESNLPVIFLYVVNLDFLMRTARTRIHTITTELQELGEFILLAAQEKASRAGVVASGVVREGNVSDEILALCREIQADYVVLGSPRLADQDVFTSDHMNQFGQRITAETGAAVVLTEDQVDG